MKHNAEDPTGYLLVVHSPIVLRPGEIGESVSEYGVLVV